MSIPGPLTWLRAARDNQARLEADPRDIFLGQWRGQAAPCDWGHVPILSIPRAAAAAPAASRGLVWNRMLGRPLVGSLAIGRLHAEVQRTFTASKMKLSIATGLGGTDYLELQVQCFEALLKPEEGRGAPTIWAKETKGL